MSMWRGLGRWRWGVLALGSVLLLLLLAPVADCFCRDRWAVSEGPTSDAFKVLPGKLGITLTAGYVSEYRGEIRRLQFQGGNVQWVESLPPAVQLVQESSPTVGMIEQITGLTVDLPYAVGGGGRFAAVRATDNDGLYRYDLDHRFALAHTSSTLAIVDLHSRREVARVDGGFRWGLEGLAWSPDGQYVAALRNEVELGLCLKEAYFAAYGMPTHLVTYYLDVYDRAGQLVASERLLSRGNWFGEIVWTE